MVIVKRTSSVVCSSFSEATCTAPTFSLGILFELTVHRTQSTSLKTVEIAFPAGQPDVAGGRAFIFKMDLGFQ